MAAFLVCKFAVALPNGAAVLVGGVPYLGTEKGTAILADQFGRKDALTAVGFAQSLPSGKFRLHLLPFIRLNDGGMTARHIILRNFTFVGLHFLFQKIHREFLLEQCITLVFFVLKDTGDCGFAPFLLAARRRDAQLFQVLANACLGLALKEKTVNQLYDPGFAFDNRRPSVLALFVAEEAFIRQMHFAIGEALALSPCDVFRNAAAFLLCQ